MDENKTNIINEEKEGNASKPTKASLASWEEKYGKGKKKKKSKVATVIITIVIVAVIAAIVAAGVWAKNMMKEATDKVSSGVQIEEFAVQDLTTYVNATGQVTSGEVETVVTTLQYPVKEIKVKVGDHVKKGDVLCVIDDTEICKNLRVMEHYATTKEKDTAKEIQEADNILEIESKCYSDTANQLANYYEMKDQTVIVADMDGIVTSINAVEGLPVSGNVMEIMNDKALQLELSIDEQSIFKVEEGMPVELSNSSLKETTGTGKLDKIYKYNTAQTGADATGSTSGGYKAIVKINSCENVLIGMTLKAKISTGNEISVQAVPYTAIMNDEKGSYVYVVTEQNGLKISARKNVETGEEGDYYTEIKGGELEEGDQVILYPDTVIEGMPVKIEE